MTGLIMMRVTYDGLDKSVYGIAMVALACFIAIVTVMVFSLNTHPSARQTTEVWIESLALNTPAIVPSGHVLRNADFANPLMDRRHSPYLPFIPLSPGNQMAGSLNPEKGEIPLKE